MLSSYSLAEPIVFDEEKINVLIIENGAFFRDTVLALRNETDGDDYGLYLSDGLDSLNLSKCAEVITDYFQLDFDARNIITQLNKEAASCCAGKEGRIASLARDILELAYEITEEMDYPVTPRPEIPTGELIKLMSITPDTESMPLPEQLLAYMNICRNLLGKKLFILVNVKSIMTAEEIAGFYRSILYEKLPILLIESYQREPPREEELVRIIDEDFCEI